MRIFGKMSLLKWVRYSTALQICLNLIVKIIRGHSIAHPYRLLLILGLFLFGNSLRAQEATAIPQVNTGIQARFEVSKDVPLLGERFEISIVVDAPANSEILNFPVIGEPLEVLEEGELAQETTGDRVSFHKTYQVVMWEVGNYLSPEGILQIQVNGAVNTVAMPSFFIQVLPQVESPETASLRPDAPLLDLDYISPLIFVGIAIVIGLLLMLVARLLQMSRRGMVRIVAASPLEKALAELEDLKVQNLPPATIYALVADYLRQYLQEKFEINAVEMTTLELNALLREKSLLEKELQRRLQQILEQADLVKFARFQPDEATSKRLVNYAMKWLRDAEAA